MVLRRAGEGPRALSALVQHGQAGAGIHEDLADGAPLVRSSLVQRCLALLIVLPVHDKLLVLGLVNQELDDVLVTEPGPVVEACLASLVRGHEGVPFIVELGQHLQVSETGRFQDAIRGLLTSLIIGRRYSKDGNLVFNRFFTQGRFLGDVHGVRDTGQLAVKRGGGGVAHAQVEL